MRLIVGKNAQVAKWVARRIPFVGEAGFGNCSTIGVVDNEGREMAGFVFHDYNPQFRTMAFSIAAVTPRWITHRLIAKIGEYVFEECQVLKLWTMTPSSNERALRLVKGLGFTKEATLAHQFGQDHAIISRMFYKDYVRLYKGAPAHGQQTAATRAA